MHIADHQEGNSFYEVTFDIEKRLWEFSETRPGWDGTYTTFFDDTESLMMCVRENCPPIFELQVREELEKR